MEVFLRRWWTKKYQKSWISKEFQEHNIFELLVEYYEDLYDQNNLEAYKDESGEIVFNETGDPLIDKWEEELARGIMPDLTEDLSQEELARLEKEKIKSKKAKELGKQLENINDSFVTGKDVLGSR